LDNDPVTRSAWRRLLTSTPSLQQYISAVILSEETLNEQDFGVKGGQEEGPNKDSRSQLEDGKTKFISEEPLVVRRLRAQGIHVGAKLDMGTEQLRLPGSGPMELRTVGLESLKEKCSRYDMMHI
jgi:fructose-bisphosphate aldolase class 1